MWLDADATIVDTSISFEDLIKDKPESHMVFGAHRKGDCITGVSAKISGSAFLVKNSEWSKDYLGRALRAQVGADNLANTDPTCLTPTGFVSAACKISVATVQADMDRISCRDGAGFCWDCDGSNSCARHAGGTWMFGVTSSNLKLSSHSGDFLVYQNNACDNLALRCYGSGGHCGAEMSLEYMTEICKARLDMCARGPEVCRDYRGTCEAEAGKLPMTDWKNKLQVWKESQATTVRPHGFGDTPADSWEKTVVPAAGWVARCSAGHKESGSAADKLAARGSARNDAVVFLMQRLDVLGAEALRGYHIDLPTFYNAKVLKAERDSGSMLMAIRDTIETNARDAMAHGPWSVLDKTINPPSGDKHDYLSAAKWFWPNDADGSKTCDFEPKEPFSALYGNNHEKFDNSAFTSMLRNTTALAFGYYFGSKTDPQTIEFADKAASNIKVWFLNHRTRMNPHMRYAGMKCPQLFGRVGFSETESVTEEGFELITFLDGVKLLRESGSMTQSDFYALQTWVKHFQEFLKVSQAGMEECKMSNHRGVMFDAIFAACSMFCGETINMAVLAQQARLRMPVHFAEDGSLPHELDNGACEHNRLLSLQAWTTLARQTALFGVDLWAPDRRWGGRSPLCTAAGANVPFFAKNWEFCKGNKVDVDMRRWWPILVEASAHCPELTYKRPFAADVSDWGDGKGDTEDDDHWAVPPQEGHDGTGLNPYSMPKLWHPIDQVPMYWQLGMPSYVPIAPGSWDSELIDYDTPMPYVGPKVDPPHPGDPNVYAPVAPHN